jgi:hypothetical protein
LVVVLLLCSTGHGYQFKYSSEIFLDDEASAIAVNPATDTAAVLDQGGKTLIVIDLVSRAITHQLPLPKAGATHIAIHKATNRAVVAGAERNLWLYDLESGELTGTVQTDKPTQALAIKEADNVALLGTPEGLKTVDLANGNLLPDPAATGDTVRVCPGQEQSTVVCRTEDGPKLATVDWQNGDIGPKISLAGDVVSLALDEPLGYLLITLAGNPGLLLFDSETLEPLGEVATEKPVEIIAVNPSTHLAFLSNSLEGTLTVVDLSKKQRVATVTLFEDLGPVAVDATRNLALAGHGHNLAVVQLENPVPQLDSLVPERATAGERGVVLSLTGSKFIKDSRTKFGERSLSTEFDSNERLRTNIPPSELHFPGNLSVAVTNPPPGGGVSNALKFEILTPMPQVSALRPDTVVREAGFHLRVEGQNFLPVSTINFNGRQIKTIFLSSTVLEAAVASSQVATEGTYPVSVTNQGKTALTSSAVDLTVVSELPEDDAATANTAVGSLTGRILDTEMWPIAGVTMKIGNLRTRTNANGEFRLDGIPAGKRVVLMDGSTAQDAEGHFPTIPVTVDILANSLNSLPFQPYLHRQKSRNFVNIDPGRDTILTDSEVPGFEMRIPKGVNITGWDGKRNLRVSVRTVPADRLPVKPLPKNANVRTVYMFYFDKVGGGVPDRPIPIKAKNDLGLLPGEKAILWYFDESPHEGEAPNDWAIAGTGTVTSDGKYIVTDPGTGIPKFCCGASGFGPADPPAPPSGPEGKCGQGGDPVDLATGYFIHEHTDLVLPGVIPVRIKRTYRSRDSGVAAPGAEGLGAFGKGMTIDYDWWLGQYQEMYLLVKPGNYQHRFDTQAADGSWVNTTDPAMRGARVTINGNLKTLRTRDGGTYTFNVDGRLIGVADRNGNTVTINRRSNFYGGDISSIVTAEGRTLTFSRTYINGNFQRLDQITDDQGRAVKYTY